MSTFQVNEILDASGGNTTTINGATPTQYNTMGRNRIINGDMRIDQRNAGAAVTYSSGTPAYLVDRWYGQGINSGGAFTLQQVTDAPAGFSNSVKATVTTASTPSTTQTYRFIQRFEGYSTADFNLGTANAVPLTMSFWVKSSLTGTFGGSFWGAGATRWFVFSYTINSADTWEYKTVEIPPVTSGTFQTTNSTSLQLTFSLGSGPDVLTSPGSWISNAGSPEYYAPTGNTNLIATNGATWYITGVQLEVGSVATPFERRPYGTELALCERYYQRIAGFNTATGTGTEQSGAGIMFKTEMRSSPTAGLTAPLQITRLGVADYTQSSASAIIAGSGLRVNTLGISLNFANFTSLPSDTCLPAIVTGGILTLSAEL